MANVNFRRGTQSQLNALITSSELNRYNAGAFYLTTDTDKLYFAQTNDKLVELNKSIIIVDYINSNDQDYNEGDSTLPTTNVEEGQFYYVKNDNILCVYLNNQWIQINSDTDTTYNLSVQGQGTDSNDGYKFSIDGTTYSAQAFYSTSQIDSKINQAYTLTQTNNVVSLVGPNNSNCGQATFTATPLAWIDGFSNS